MNMRSYRCDILKSDCIYDEDKQCIDCPATTIHLCNSCKYEYPSCQAKDIHFGCEFKSEERCKQDNIFQCSSYIENEEITTVIS